MGASQSLPGRAEAEKMINDYINNPRGRGGEFASALEEDLFEEAFDNKVSFSLIKKLIDNQVARNVWIDAQQFVHNGDVQSTLYLLSKKPNAFKQIGVSSLIDQNLKIGKNLDTIKIILEKGGLDLIDLKSHAREVIKYCRTDIAKSIFSNQLSVNDPVFLSYTPLILSIESNCVDIFKFLIEKGALPEDPAKMGTDEPSPLSTVAKVGNSEMFNILMEKNVNPDGYYNKNGTREPSNLPLQSAVEYRHNAIAKMLIDKGSYVLYLFTDGSGRGNLDYLIKTSIVRYDNVGIYKYIKEKKPDIKIAHEKEIFMDSLEKGSIELCKYLLETGDLADWSKDFYFFSNQIIDSSIKSNSLEILKLVIEKFPSLNFMNVILYPEKTYELLEVGNIELIKFLIGQGVKLRVNDEYRNSVNAFIYYLLRGGPNFAEVIKILIDYGVNINQKIPATGDTPLILMVKHNDRGKVKVLIDNGADVNITNNQGHDASYYASNDDMTSLLSTASGQQPTTGLTPIQKLEQDAEDPSGTQNPNPELVQKKTFTTLDTIDFTYSKDTPVYNYMMGMDETLPEILENEEDRYLIVVKESLSAIPVEQIDNNIKDGSYIKYACTRQISGAPLKGQVYARNPLVYLPGPGGSSFLVFLEQLNLVLANSNIKAIQLTKIGDIPIVSGFNSIINPRAVSDSFVKNYRGEKIDIVSADHCQAGTDKQYYNITVLNLIPAPSPESSQGGKRRRTYRRKQKKSNKTGKRSKF